MMTFIREYLLIHINEQHEVHQGHRAVLLGSQELALTGNLALVKSSHARVASDVALVGYCLTHARFYLRRLFLA